MKKEKINKTPADNIDDIFESKEFEKLTLWASEKEEKKRKEELEDFEEERDIKKFACFIRAMLSYFCNVTGKEMAKDLFDVEINDWKEDDTGGYHSGNFQIMQKDLYRFLCKCDDKRTRAIAIQSMKYLRGEK